MLLDLHNTAGRLGVIFYFVMAFSGVPILASVYYPSGVWVAFDGGRSGQPMRSGRKNSKRSFAMSTEACHFARLLPPKSQQRVSACATG
jgi:hypothetical protein